MTGSVGAGRLRARAYAKINLTLDVFSRRDDGYHSIASVLQSIALHDTLEVWPTEGSTIEFRCNAPGSPDVPLDATNLVVRAAMLLRERCGEPGRGVAMELTKHVPSQAGLGGGSSDASAALLAVNRALALGADAPTLQACAAELGSDVPFFLDGGTALARGRGEKLTALPDIEPLWLVVVKPDEAVSTGWAYGQLDAAPERASHRATGRMEVAIRERDQERVIAGQTNDFELPVFAHFPNLAWLHDELQMAGALGAHLCGSGAALYGIAPDRRTASAMAARMRPRYPQTFITRTLSRAEVDPFTELSKEPDDLPS